MGLLMEKHSRMRGVYVLSGEGSRNGEKARVAGGECAKGKGTR